MRKTKTSTKKNSSNVKYTIRFDNIIFEDNHVHKNFTSNFKIISDKNKPFYEYKYKEMRH